jgi:ubiquinone/menaquinone biosynthesis C-methylase UbiE
MDRPSLGAYVEPAAHEAISNIIRRYSTNPADVRRRALQDLDLTGAARLLDLGCGFGFMVEALKGIIPPDAEIVGVDMHSSNRDIFLARAEAAAGSARFICRTLESNLDFPERSFDAVIASYSLYFFPGVIPDVARVLKPNGVLVTLTHSETHFQSMLDAVGFPPHNSNLHSLLVEFSAENGAARLGEHFGAVEYRPYPNTLIFHADDLDDYLTLMRFKLQSLLPAKGPPMMRPDDFLARARDLLVETGCVLIEKDDAVFIAREPRHS